MKIHELKTDYDQLRAIFNGIKKVELRKNDRHYKKGDVLHLKAYDRESKTYSSEWALCNVTHILHGDQFGIRNGYCAMSINVLLTKTF